MARGGREASDDGMGKMFEEDQVSASSENHDKLQRNRGWPDLCAPARVRKRTLPPRPERGLVLKAFGAQQREKSVCGNQVCWEDVGVGPEVPCKGWEWCESGEGKGVSTPKEKVVAWDGVCVCHQSAT